MYKRAIAIGIILSIVGPFCIVAVYYCQFYHLLYREAQTEISQEMESRLSLIEQRLGKLEGHIPRRPTPVFVKGIISTTDVPPTESWMKLPPSSTNGAQFQVIRNKDGLWIVPELRLQAGSTNQQQFDIHVSPDIGTVAHGWLSFTEPYGQLASFDRFDLYHSYPETNLLLLSARAKPGNPVRMEFTTVLLVEHE